MRKTVTETDVEVRDYLVPLSVAERVKKFRRKQHALNVGCWHPRLKQFAFAEGKALDGSIIKRKTIKMCPDCTTFDAGRHRALCFGQALKTCTTIGTPISNEEFARINRNRFLSFDGKYEGPTTKRTDTPSSLSGWDRKKLNPAVMMRWMFSGMSHLVSERHDEVMIIEERCYFLQRLETLSYKGADAREPAMTYYAMMRGGVRGPDRERKPKPPYASKPREVSRQVAERTTKPTQYVAKVEPEWVVVPLSSTKVVGPLPWWEERRRKSDHEQLECLYEFPVYRKPKKGAYLTAGATSQWFHHQDHRYWLYVRGCEVCDARAS